MSTISSLQAHLPDLLGVALLSQKVDLGELTLEVENTSIKEVCEKLRDDPQCRFDQLIDLCGMDYSEYGSEESDLNNGQNNHQGNGEPWAGSRYAVVYHLLSLNHNLRIRIRAQLDDNQPVTDSIIDVWPVADWFEREAFDLFGIIFTGHPDLRRLLTDYGFIGHPFRKDFPLSGQVEMHYDEKQGRVVYIPVTVEERILVPRTIRKDTFAGSRRSAPNTGNNTDNLGGEPK
jgi:NADH-quinone oxidoreductase subunit C